MDELIALQKRNMYLSLAAMAVAAALAVLGILGVTGSFSESIAVIGLLLGILLFLYGLSAFFKFRKRAAIAEIIGKGILANWKYDTPTWPVWLARNRDYEKVDLWNGKGFVFAYCLTLPALAVGFAAGVAGGVISSSLIAAALCILPILNGLIYRRKQRRPEVFLSRYGAFVGPCLLRFFNRRDGSFISKATIVPEESFPYMELELTQTGTGRGEGFSGSHTTTRRILIPPNSVEDAERMLEPLCTKYKYETAMSERSRSAGG